MFTYFNHQKERILFSTISRVVVCTLSLSLIFAPSALQAQSINLFNLPAPGTMVLPSPVYNPAIVTGIKIYPEDPFKFDFIINNGDDQLQGEELKGEAQKLINYFMATLTVPDDEMWVNLSPYEKDRIIADGLSHTAMGRDMLAQDYLLKQFSASMMYPESEFGKSFWDRVYSKAQEKYGTTEIPMNTFNKIWIVPSEALVYVHKSNVPTPKSDDLGSGPRPSKTSVGVFVARNHLKVMLEEDYLALESNKNSTKHGLGDVSQDDLQIISGVQSEIVRDILIPEIEKEINTGKHFANLRQMYNSMLLATWYKRNLKNSLLGKIYANTNMTNGIKIEDKHVKEKIYNQYVEAFEKGVYNYIKEDIDATTQEMIPRKYFSGGLAHYKNAIGSTASPGFIEVSSPILAGMHSLAQMKGEILRDDGASSPVTLDSVEQQKQKIFIINEPHKSPQKMGRVAQVAFDDSYKSGTEGNAEKLIYQQRIEEILEEYQNEIVSLRSNIQRLRNVVSNRVNGITAIGVESEENELASLRENSRDSLSDIRTNLESRAVEDFSRKAEDLFLLLNKPAALLVATNDSILEGVEFVALESREERERVFLLLDKSQNSQERLKGLVQDGDVSREPAIEFFRFINQVLKDKRVPSDSEISEKTTSFKNTDARSIVDEISSNTIDFIKLAGERDTTMIRRILSLSNNMVIMPGRQHAAGIKNGLKILVGDSISIIDESSSPIGKDAFSGVNQNKGPWIFGGLRDILENPQLDPEEQAIRIVYNVDFRSHLQEKYIMGDLINRTIDDDYSLQEEVLRDVTDLIKKLRFSNKEFVKLYGNRVAKWYVMDSFEGFAEMFIADKKAQFSMMADLPKELKVQADEMIAILKRETQNGGDKRLEWVMGLNSIRNRRIVNPTLEGWKSGILSAPTLRKNKKTIEVLWNKFQSGVNNINTINNREYDAQKEARSYLEAQFWTEIVKPTLIDHLDYARTDNDHIVRRLKSDVLSEMKYPVLDTLFERLLNNPDDPRFSDIVQFIDQEFKQNFRNIKDAEKLIRFNGKVRTKIESILTSGNYDYDAVIVRQWFKLLGLTGPSYRDINWVSSLIHEQRYSSFYFIFNQFLDEALDSDGIDSSNASSPIKENDKKSSSPIGEKKREFTHSVGNGETLYHIGAKYGLTQDDLEKFNGIDSLAIFNVKEGEEVKIQLPDGEDVEFIHTVKEGESWKSIADRYYLTQKVVKKYLRSHSHSPLKEGQKLKIVFSSDGSVEVKEPGGRNNSMESVSVRQLLELLDRAFDVQGEHFEVTLRSDKKAVGVDKTFIDEHRDEIIGHVRILEKSMFDYRGWKIEEGLTHASIAEVPDYHLGPRGSLRLIAVGVALGLWEVGTGAMFVGAPRMDIYPLVINVNIDAIASSPIHGGIDFNPNNINLNEQGDTIQINFSATDLQNLHPESINGILPVIINISPLPSVLPLLGLKPREDEEFEISSLN